MNRQMKRAQKRQGTQVERAQAAAQARRQQLTQKRERTGARQFLKEVRQELKKVIWPTRQELITYTIVVLVTVTVMTSFVYGLDIVFSKFVLNVFTN
jgi:preprotein translocase subunit SecE